MSQENVELVLGLYPPPDVDNVQLYSDDNLWTGFAEALAPFFHADFACVMYEFGGEKHYAGLDGLRAFMLDWTSPWVTYRIETDEGIDLGEQVLILNTDYGRREANAHEVTGQLAVVFTFRDGKIARMEAYTTREAALKAVGLAE
jgi:ketosteroid isomerase-like protein